MTHSVEHGTPRHHMPGCILDPGHGAGCVREQWAASDPEAPWNRVEILRKAAALIRERADLPYVKGEWEVVGNGGIHKRSSSPRIHHPWLASTCVNLHNEDDEREVNQAVAEHIASWHPAVALAVADWLDEVARQKEIGGVVDTRMSNRALAVARAYLGEPDA